MKVALVLYHFPVRSETFVIQHALALCRSGADLTIIVQKDGEGWENFDPKVAAELMHRVYVLPAIAWRQWPYTFLRRVLSYRGVSFLALNRFAVQAGCRDVVKHLPTWTELPPLGRFDAVLAHFGPVGVVALILRKAGFISGPIATIFHGFEMSRKVTISRYKKGYSSLFDLGELILPVSELWRKKLIHWGAPKEKTEVLHMGVDLPDEPPDFSREIGCPLRILSVGRLAHKKAHADVIEAVARSNAKIALELIGAGELEATLKDLAKSIQNNEIRFLGSRPHSEVLQAISRADLFILPSVTAENGEMEGIPVVLMEAMANGTIIIATKHSGIPELVIHGNTGFLVDEHDPDAIAQIIEEIAVGEYDLPAIRQRGYERIRAEFSNQDLNVKLLNILKRLANAH